MLPRILIVDDESSICISLSLALEPEYEVVWETDPISALERLQTEPIDLVLLDMVIGPYDGLDILMKIKKLAPLAAVIMMTWTPMPRSRNAFRRSSPVNTGM